MDLGKSAVPGEVDVSVRANGEPCKLLGHYDPLRRAFANLLRNAAEAMGGRGSIEIAVSRDGAGLAVTIADHGAGIPDDLRQRVFEPYFTTKHDGTGLGLALVRQTIEAHNGSITVAETPGGGATVMLPLRSEEHTSELQSLTNLVCRRLLEKKKQPLSTADLTTQTQSQTKLER